jgi:hypothetical protein
LIANKLSAEIAKHTFELLHVLAGHSATQVLSVDLFFVSAKAKHLKFSLHCVS